MDKKRNILIREMMELIDQAKDIQSQIDETFRTAYAALQKANMEIGIAFVDQISHTVPVEDSIRIKTRSVMGTEIPLVEYDKKASNTPTYAYYSTKLSLDEAKAAFERVKELSIQLSMIENAAIRLATNIKKTQKRANALKNITIPRYETLTRDITNALEEKEREEFTRLKVIKRMKLKQLKKSSADLSGSAEDFWVIHTYPHLKITFQHLAVTVLTGHCSFLSSFPYIR